MSGHIDGEDEPKKFGRTLFGLILTVGGLGFGVKAVAAIKEILIARTFGVGEAVDAYVVGYILPSFAIVALVHTFHPALVPIALAVRKEHGRRGETRLFSSVLGLVLIGLTVVGVLMFLSSTLTLRILTGDFEADTFALTSNLFLLMLPMVPAAGIAMVATAALHVEERFILASVIPALTPLTVLGFLLVMGSSYGIYPVALGMLAGSILEAGILLARAWYVRGIFLPSLRVHERFRQLIRRHLPLIGSFALMSATVPVDQAMAATLGAGSVALLSYGSRLVLVAMGPLKIAVDRVAIPFFSKLIEEGSWDDLRSAAKRSMLSIAMLTLPVMLLFVFMSEPLVRLIFEGGAFTALDTDRTAVVQTLFALQIPFFVGVSLLVSLLFSLGQNVKHLWLASGTLVANAVANLVLMRYMGVAGIALATSVVSVFYFGSALYVVRGALRDRMRDELRQDGIDEDPMSEIGAGS